LAAQNQHIIDLQAARSTVRNNIFDLSESPYSGTGNTGRDIVRIIAHNDAGLDSNGNEIYGNTIYRGDSFEDGTIICDLLAGTGHICKNNLVYAPNIQGSATSCSGSGVDCTNNINIVLSSGNPFAGTVPGYLVTLIGDLSGFNLGAGSSAIDAGSSSVLFPYDINNVRRPIGSSFDVGAFEYGVPSTSVCGNSIVESGEDCDSLNLNSQTCGGLEFDSGTLSCSSCSFDTSGCSNNPSVILSSLGNFTGEAGVDSFTIVVVASDPENDSLTYWVERIPVGGDWNVSSLTFTWAPSSSQFGLFNMTFIVGDGTTNVSEVVFFDVSGGVIVDDGGSSGGSSGGSGESSSGDYVVAEEGTDNFDDSYVESELEETASVLDLTNGLDIVEADPGKVWIYIGGIIVLCLIVWIIYYLFSSRKKTKLIVGAV
jgi:hypothetical protein